MAVDIERPDLLRVLLVALGTVTHVARWREFVIGYTLSLNTYRAQEIEETAHGSASDSQEGPEGDAVKGLQNALNGHSQDYLDVDGTFSAKTEGVVKRFQADRHLDADGIVSPKTWTALEVHMVQSGDTLSGIAEQRLGDASRWSEIVDLNRALISDPDEIFPGQVLALPNA
jgi:nucleoid-associated protein YgaU